MFEFSGTVDRVYALLNCTSTPFVGNKDDSYLTIISDPGLVFAIINIVGKWITMDRILNCLDLWAKDAFLR